MTKVLYNCHHDGDQYRISKFVDGELESSYLTTHSECDCPAGHRTSCRHRQMLPQMIFLGIVNQPYFIDWDNKREGLVLDFEGNEIPPVPKVQPAIMGNWREVAHIANIETTELEPHSQVVTAEAFDASIGGSNPPAVATFEDHERQIDQIAAMANPANGIECAKCGQWHPSNLVYDHTPCIHCGALLTAYMTDPTGKQWSLDQALAITKPASWRRI